MTEQTNLPPEEEEKDMSFLQHLEILRWHLIRSAIVILVSAIAAFVAKGLVFGKIIMGPKSADFITYQWLCQVSKDLSAQFPGLIAEDAICIGQNLPNLVNYDMSGQFTTHIMVSIIAGLVVSFPYIMWEVWRFIKPALKSPEKRYSRGVVFFTSLLFACGVLFGYFIICPLSVNFFLNYQVDPRVPTFPQLSSYISLVTSIVMATGIVFELPIIVFFLSKTGLVTPQLLKKYRRHAFVFSLVLSAIITPPDVFSQLLVSVPLVVLYEVSIFISKMVLKKKKNSDVY